MAITLIDKNSFHNIRVRNHEADLRPVTVPLQKVLGPIQVESLCAAVEAVDTSEQTVQINGPSGPQLLPYDRLIIALGSQLHKPDIPGLKQHSFDVDTYYGALRLQAHLKTLASQPDSEARNTVLVVGAGLTGLEIATALPPRLNKWLAGAQFKPQVILADASNHIGSDMGEEARVVIDQALQQLGIKTLTNINIQQVDAHGVTLDNGQHLDADTVVWSAGMRANPLISQLGLETDRLGRLPVNKYLQVNGLENVFAAGDAAQAVFSDGESVMSCQHSRPMGRFAGYFY